MLIALQHKGLDVITLFHNPSVPASIKVLSLLKRASAVAGETATEDQASDHTYQTQSSLTTEFELNVTEDPPTPDQLKSILEYVGAKRANEIVSGAKDEKDALSKWKQDKNSFVRPLVGAGTPSVGGCDGLTVHRRLTGTMERL